VSLVLLEQVIAMLVLFSMTGQVQMATVFGSPRWDRGNPNSRLACYQNRRIVDSRDWYVAHNTLPCHTKLLVVNPRTRRAAVAHVADRGPRHADIDLSRLVAQRLEHNGRENIIMIPLGRGDPDPDVSGSGHGPQQTTTAAGKAAKQGANHRHHVKKKPPKLKHLRATARHHAPRKHR